MTRLCTIRRARVTLVSEMCMPRLRYLFGVALAGLPLLILGYAWFSAPAEQLWSLLLLYGPVIIIFEEYLGHLRGFKFHAIVLLGTALYFTFGFFIGLGVEGLWHTVKSFLNRIRA